MSAPSFTVETGNGPAAVEVEVDPQDCAEGFFGPFQMVRDYGDFVAVTSTGASRPDRRMMAEGHERGAVLTRCNNHAAIEDLKQRNREHLASLPEAERERRRAHLATVQLALDQCRRRSVDKPPMILRKHPRDTSPPEPLFRKLFNRQVFVRAREAGDLSFDGVRLIAEQFKVFIPKSYIM